MPLNEESNLVPQTAPLVSSTLPAPHDPLSVSAQTFTPPALSVDPDVVTPTGPSSPSATSDPSTSSFPVSVCPSDASTSTPSNLPSDASTITSANLPSDASTTSAPSTAHLGTQKGPKGARNVQFKTSGAKRGRKSTWPPKKLAWLESHVTQCIASADRMAFYDRILFLWWRIFGRSLPLKEDPEGDIDEAAAIAMDVSEEALTEEEKRRRKLADRELREILANWFRNRMGKIDKSNDGSTFADFIDIPLTGEARTLPRRLGVLKYYMSNYWEARIKNVFIEIRDRNNALWEAMVASGESAGQKKPESASAQNEAVARVWASETDEFKAKVKKERDEERKLAEDELQRLMAPNDGPHERTPEEYQAAIDNAAKILQPVVSAIFDKMGLVSTLVIAGPMPNKNGEIKVRALTHGRTADFEQQLFPDAMKTQYFAICSAMHDFAAKCFPKSVCESRALKTEGQDPSPFPDSSAPANPLPATSVTSPSPTPTAVLPAPSRPLHEESANATSASASASPSPSSTSVPTLPTPLTPTTSMSTPVESNTGLSVPTHIAPSSCSPADGLHTPETHPNTNGPTVAPKPRPRPVPIPKPTVPPPGAAPNVPNTIPDHLIDPALLENGGLALSTGPHAPAPVAPSTALMQPPSPHVPIFAVAAQRRPQTPPPLQPPKSRSPLGPRQSQQSLASPPSPAHTSIMEVFKETRPAVPPLQSPPTQLSTRVVSEDVNPPDLHTSVDPTNLPQRMERYYRLFVKGKGRWGEGWARCVEAFVRVEGIDGCPVESNGPRFTSQSRPGEVEKWFKYARPIEDRPIEDLDVWARSWWSWWENLAPGRSVCRGSPEDSVNADGFSWACLNVTTSCGLLVVITSLSWWGLAVMKPEMEPEKIREWEDAVAEVRYAFTKVAEFKEAEEAEEEENEEEEGPTGSSPKGRKRGAPSHSARRRANKKKRTG